MESETGKGKPLRIRKPSFASRATVEAYLAASVLPRYMERLREIHDELAAHRIRLEHAYRDMAERHEGDELARRWRELARGWNFDYVNDLIRQHNDNYPIEANLPVDPRTGDYVTLTRRPYQHPLLGPEWVLEQFPPTRGSTS
jgi:hypothetical protein